ncbi:hypothetical protein KM043_000154 [Ampulex compressa]|nr:hypothetical protein KM043_000154 [Ampulex compressa]
MSDLKQRTAILAARLQVIEEPQKRQRDKLNKTRARSDQLKEGFSSLYRKLSAIERAIRSERSAQHFRPSDPSWSQIVRSSSSAPRGPKKDATSGLTARCWAGIEIIPSPPVSTHDATVAAMGSESEDGAAGPPPVRLPPMEQGWTTARGRKRKMVKAPLLQKPDAGPYPSHYAPACGPERT